VKALLAATIVLAGFSSVHAVSPVIWKQDTQAAFAAGEATNVTVTRDGEVRLGPNLELFADTGEEFVWSIAKGSGGDLFSGTGPEGKVFRLGAGASTLMFDSPERAIFGLVVGKDGTVYAGSSPGGLIYAIPPKGEPRTFARTGDQHVWALVEDGSGGLYAATGGRQGRVLRVSGSGEVDVVLESGDPNVTSLLRSGDGTLYAGTDQNGLIYRIPSAGKADVLYDAPQNEIKALALSTEGTLYAGATDSQSNKAGRPSPGGQAGRNGGGGGAKGQAVVYAIKPSGSGWRLWDVPEAQLQAMGMTQDGALTIVTGDQGRIYRLFTDGTHEVLTRVEDGVPWQFLDDGRGGGWVATTGGGTVLRLDRAPAAEGVLTSEPEDFSLITKWGRVSWEGDAAGGSSATFEVRVGNSEVPDETWGGWAPVSADGLLTARPARYLQYRATLKGGAKHSPTIRSVSVSGLPENIQPLVIDLAVRGPHEEKSGGQGKNGGGRRGGPPEESTTGWEITWTGADANNDVLTYALHFKGRTEKNWKLLAEDVRANSYTWDTESAPEGSVLIRLTASDAASNPASMALSSERVSAPFTIDHTEPVVTIANVEPKSGIVSVTGTILDATSAVTSAAYSVDSGDWQVVFPTDDVFDSREETLKLQLNGLGNGEHTIVIKAADARGNVGVAKRVFDAP